MSDNTGFLEEVKRFLGVDWLRTEHYMRESITTDVPLLKHINEIVCEHSGKQLRPVLSLLMARLVSNGRISDDSCRVAAASELLHTATLMHDDVADEAEKRRGSPTIKSLYGNTPSVLIGDFWLSSAVNLVINIEPYDDVVPLFSRTLADLASGEMLQLEKAGTGDTSLEDYFRIIYSKTASLFVATIEGAAAILKPGRQYIESARSYARALGLAFQIKDDILDYCGKDEMGKSSGLDLVEKKITLPLLKAFENSDREAEIRSKLCETDKHPEYVDEIRQFVLNNGGIEGATQILEQYVENAVKALDCFEDSPEKTYLARIARFNVLRTI